MLIVVTLVRDDRESLHTLSRQGGNLIFQVKELKEQGGIGQVLLTCSQGCFAMRLLAAHEELLLHQWHIVLLSIFSVKYH